MSGKLRNLSLVYIRIFSWKWKAGRAHLRTVPELDCFHFSLFLCLSYPPSVPCRELYLSKTKKVSSCEESPRVLDSGCCCLRCSLDPPQPHSQ